MKFSKTLFMSTRKDAARTAAAAELDRRRAEDQLRQPYGRLVVAVQAVEGDIGDGGSLILHLRNLPENPVESPKGSFGHGPI